MNTKHTVQLDVPIYSKEAKEVGKTTLPASVFGTPWNADLVHEVVTSMQLNAREGTAHTKGRGEVRGGGKKPWRQKGTGRARHGSTRSPIWVGGGVAHGPRTEKSYARKINKNARARALACVLSQKLTDGEMLFVDTLGFTAPKAKEARSIVAALGSLEGKKQLATKRANAAVVVLPERDLNAERSFQNFGNIAVVQAKDVNPVELLTHKYVVVVAPDVAVKTLEGRVASKAKRVATKAPKASAVKA